MMKPILSILALLVCCITAIAQPTSEWGCTDPAAPNYNSTALFDDGSCCYDGTWVIITASGDGYFSFGNNQIGFLGAVSYPTQTGFCLPDVCAYVNVQNYAGLGSFTWSISDLQGNVLASGEAVDNYYDFAYLQGSSAVSGCTDPAACNFDPEANCSDYGLCTYDCYGCTDPEAINYNPQATIDNGTCCVPENYLTVIAPESPDFYTYFNIYDYNGGGVSVLNGVPFCLQDGCYQIYSYSDGYAVTGDTIFYSIVNSLGDLIFSGYIDPVAYIPSYFSLDAIPGCLDPSACNYDPQANCGDFNLCTYGCYGCTDPTAMNYNEEAIYDDGSCCSSGYTIVADGAFTFEAFSGNYQQYVYGNHPSEDFLCLDNGCFTFNVFTQPNGLGFTESVNWQLLDAAGNVVYSGNTPEWGGSSSISLNAISGCTDASACNFDPAANCADPSACDYSCLGCTDPSAPNYSADAQFDDGSCCYDNWFTVSANYPGWWSLSTGNGEYYMSGHYPEDNGFCLPELCFSIQFFADDYSVTDVTLSVSQGNEVLATGGFDPMYGSVLILLENGALSGCMDMWACNFNPEATCPDYSACNYDCYGCTDPASANYNPEATIENGTCCYSSWYTVEISGPAFWSVWSSVNGNSAWGSYPEQNGFCMDETCFNFSLWSADGSPVTYSIIDDQGNTVYQGEYNSTDYNGVLIAFGDFVEGCMDPAACNYDPNATCGQYYLCDYSCYGCTDADAPNFDSDATLDNGTCCYDSWYTVNMTGPAYWYASSATSYYVGGFFPEVNGFCMSSSCFSIFVYSYDDNPVEYTITDVNGNEVFAGVAYPYAYQVESINLSDEVAGCTDSFACNYNPVATCEDGSCQYYCGGCLDEEALNYNPMALYDDGTCFYQVLPPLMGMTMMPDEENDQFYVVLNMMDEGNGAPYMMVNSYDGQPMMMDESGQYIAGPYPCDEEIDFTLQSMAASMMVYMNASMQGACAIISNVEDEPIASQLSLYPNPGQGLFTLTGVVSSRCEVRVFDIAGKLVMQENKSAGSGMMQLDLSNLDNGIYQIQVADNGKTETIRAILQK